MSPPSDRGYAELTPAAGQHHLSQLRTTVTVTATRGRKGWHRRSSTDLIVVSGTGGRIDGSVRSAPDADSAGPAILLRNAASDQLAGFDAAITRQAQPGFVLQAAVVDADGRAGSYYRRRTGGTGGPAPHVSTVRLLVRAESGAGPLLFGGVGVGAGVACADSLGEITAITAVARCPDVADWLQHPLVLRPAAAAAVIVGARMALGSPSAAKLNGRRVLPDLTLIDEPAGDTTGRADDASRVAESLLLIDRGRVATPLNDTATGLVTGRSVWDHEQARLTAAAHLRLSLSGDPGQDVPDDALELRWCVEGLRRYYPDGRVRMVCIARHPDTPGWFLLELSARPLSLLRAVVGVSGPETMTYNGHEVHTPSLILPSAAELSRSGGNGGVRVREV